MDSLDIYTSVTTTDEKTDAHPPEHILAVCEHSIATYAHDVDNYEQHLFALGCRKWSCAICGPRKRAILVRRITRAAPTKFITLTCRHETTPLAQLTTLRKALPKLINTIRKTIGDIEYLRALEYCRDGYPHYHLLARTKYIEQKTLSRLWEQLTNARVVDIRKAHGRSTSYVAKYLSKATATHDTWTRQQFAVSRNFWQDDDTTTQWLNWETKRIPVYEAAASVCEVHSLERVAIGCYKIVDQDEDNRGVPHELEPKWWSRDAWSSDVSHNVGSDNLSSPTT